jgi:hypothetical protein
MTKFLGLIFTRARPHKEFTIQTNNTKLRYSFKFYDKSGMRDACGSSPQRDPTAVLFFVSISFSSLLCVCACRVRDFIKCLLL